MVSPDSSPFSELVKSLFETKTVSPIYKKPHILYTIYIIGREKTGIGRYRIKNEVDLGEGSTKTLLNRLKDENIIHVDGSRQRGHTLSPKGELLFNKIVQTISYPREIENPNNSYVIGEKAFYALINPKYALIDYTRQTLAMRDEAIKIGGSGCSTLEFNGTKWFFPDSDSYKIDLRIQPNSSIPLKKGTLMVIGGGSTQTSAILATFAASLLITRNF
ncbi:MAG: DUF4443 domain-containing protein [Promethearchaeota archaeon]